MFVVYNTPMNWETLTLRLFMWAAVNVQSRVMGGEICGEPRDHVLIPLYDMMNHAFDRNVKSINDEGIF